MSVSTESDGPVDPNAATIPMAARAVGEHPGQQGQRSAPPPSRWQKVTYVTQILYHLVAILVLLGGLAMHFGWLDSWWGGGNPWHSSFSRALPSPTTTAHPQLTALLGQDTFRRPDQVLWGVASDGTAWAGDANIASAFAVAGRYHHRRRGLLHRAARSDERQRSGPGLCLYQSLQGGARQPGRGVALERPQRLLQGLSGWDPVGGAEAGGGERYRPGYGGLRVLLERGTIVRVTAFQEQYADQVA